MMKPAACIERGRRRARSQQGDALFEALIGFVLLLVLGLGLSYAAARALHNQRYASTQSIALNQLRGSLQTTGVQSLCNGGTASVTIKPAGGDAQVIPVATPSCTRDSVSVGVAANAALSVTLKDTASSVVTRMRFATPEDNDSARGLLGDGATVLTQ